MEDIKKYLIRQNKKTPGQLSFSGAANYLGIKSGERYTLTLFQGSEQIYQVARARFRDPFLRNWKKLFFKTEGMPLIVWKIGDDEIGFKSAEGSENSEVENFINVAFQRFSKRYYTGQELNLLKVFKLEITRSNNLSFGGLKLNSRYLDDTFSCLVKARCDRLGVENITVAQKIDDDKVIFQIRASTWLEGEHSKNNAETLQRGRLQIYFKSIMMLLFDGKCAFCGCSVANVLDAAHILPWSRCSNEAERTDECNGLLLCANHHRLY